MSKPKAHQLYKQAPTCVVNVGISSGTATSLVGAEWEYLEQIPSGQTYQAYVYRSYIDLSGWTKQDLTTFTTGIDIQKDRIPLAVIAAPGSCPIIWEFDIISTRKIRDNELINLVVANPPGFHGSTVDLMSVIYGEQVTYAANSNIPGTYIKTSAGTWGSGNPTASEKLHWTRIYITTFSSPEDKSGAFNAFATNLVVQATTMEEKDLVYIERLRRSYELQGEL